MKWRLAVPLLSLLVWGFILACNDGFMPSQPVQASFTAGERTGFGFNGTASGFPTGAVRLTGGGSYVPITASNAASSDTKVVSSGGFDCDETISQGPLNGCQEDQGVRWDTAQ